MRLALWIGLFALGLAGVFVPVLYQHLSAELPPLDSVEELRAQFGRSATRAHVPGGEQTTRAEVPEFSRLPRELVAVYVSQAGCHAYFESPREDGLPWLWRMLSGVWGIELGGDGKCERLFALRIASALGLGSGASQSVAANKIHRLLQKHELIAYDLSTAAFEPSVVGVDAVAQTLFRKELKGLQLSEVAELMLALPPHELYEELKKCRNASLIRQSRDYVLSMLVSHALVSSEQAAIAQSHPVACTRN